MCGALLQKCHYKSGLPAWAKQKVHVFLRIHVIGGPTNSHASTQYISTLTLTYPLPRTQRHVFLRLHAIGARTNSHANTQYIHSHTHTLIHPRTNAAPWFSQTVRYQGPHQLTYKHTKHPTTHPYTHARTQRHVFLRLYAIRARRRHKQRQ